jgi:hypothetical protein
LVVGAPGQDDHQGAVYLISFGDGFFESGTPKAMVELSASTWGQAGPTLVGHTLFGASLAIKGHERGFELAVGSPGAHDEAGAVTVFDMAPRVVKSSSQLGRPCASTEHSSCRHFGSTLAYSSSGELLVGMATQMYAVVRRSANLSSPLLYLPLLSQDKAPDLHTPLASAARRVAVLARTDDRGDSLEPLFWMSQPRKTAAPLGWNNIAARPKPQRPTARLGRMADQAGGRSEMGVLTVAHMATGLAAALGTCALLSTLVRRKAQQQRSINIET